MNAPERFEQLIAFLGSHLPAPVDQQEVRRLAEAVAQAAQHLQTDIEIDLGQSARFVAVLQAADSFAEAAEHLRASVAAGVDIEHARTDFTEVDNAWQELSDRLYSPSLRPFEHLHQAASGVAPRVGEVSRSLGVFREPSPLSRSPTSASRTTSSSARSLDRDFVWLPEWQQWVPITVVPLDDEWLDESVVDDDFPTIPDRQAPLGEHRSLEEDSGRSRFQPTAPSLPNRQPRGLTPQPAPRLLEPRSNRPTEESDGHNHEHGDGHDHSRAQPSPTPKKSAPTPAPSAKQVIPHPAELELDPVVRESLAKLSPEDRAAAIAQRTCPVTGDLLGEMGTPIKVRVQGRDVFVCCQGCVKKLQKDPQKYLGGRR